MPVLVQCINELSLRWPNTVFALFSAEVQRVYFSGGVDSLSNVSAGTKLQATAESAGASARHHTQDGRHSGETIFCALLPGVACTPCVTVKMAGKILRFSDEGLAEKYFSAWKSGKVGGCCNHENCFSKRLLFSSEGLSHYYRIQHYRSRSC